MKLWANGRSQEKVHKSAAEGLIIFRGYLPRGLRLYVPATLRFALNFTPYYGIFRTMYRTIGWNIYL